MLNRNSIFKSNQTCSRKITLGGCIDRRYKEKYTKSHNPTPRKHTDEMVVAIPIDMHTANSKPSIITSMERQNSMTTTTAGHGTNPTAIAQASTPFVGLP
jgi:hypothetical protein